MNKALITTLIVIAVLALAGGLFFFGSLYGRSQAFGFPGMMTLARGASAGVGGAGGHGGMMGGRGGYGGMMGGYSGMVNGRGGMMGGPGGYGYNNANAIPLTVEQARTAAQAYLGTLKDADLAIAEVMIFDNNAYIAVKETSTGRGAFELLVNSGSQAAYPEHGPNMMWNTKYGGLNHTNMMGGRGGMMGGYGSMMGGGAGWNSAPSTADAAMTVTPEQAVKDAQQYLDSSLPGTLAADDPLAFYGYYTLDFTRDGKVAGMLSVNGYTGQVFLHTWHGNFVEEAE